MILNYNDVQLYGGKIAENKTQKVILLSKDHDDMKLEWWQMEWWHWLSIVLVISAVTAVIIIISYFLCLKRKARQRFNNNHVYQLVSNRSYVTENAIDSKPIYKKVKKSKSTDTTFEPAIENNSIYSKDNFKSISNLEALNEATYV